jgi:GTP-binding protein LepA
MNSKNIRNFSIIAHIDHGKSTLADRILELTETVQKREMQEQLLDTMTIERERGITIKLNAVQLKYIALDGEEYIFHLIDTPGHVDFTYEVSRSLAACEGAIVVVDASQGIEAQTLANVYLALENNLEIIPVINKIDLPSADPERVKQEIEDVIGIDASDAPMISAKNGTNVRDVLEAIVKKVPAPQANEKAPLRALIFDSHYDQYRGAIANVRIMDGKVKVGDKIKMMSTGKSFVVNELGINTPTEVKKRELVAGEVGYISAGVKEVKDTTVGDTITLTDNAADLPLPGYRKLNSMVFCGIYPVDSDQYMELKDALEKLSLSDSSLNYEPETSQALGFGFRCGFLGLLHVEIVQERLEREYGINLIVTAPSVIYKVHRTNGVEEVIDNPANMPDPQVIDVIEEPFVKVSIMLPNQYVGSIMELCQNKRGTFITSNYLDRDRLVLEYEMPLSEIVYDFFDKLKSYSKGYSSFDYELLGYKPSKLAKMDILMNGEKIDALAIVVHKDFAFNRGKAIVEKLKNIIPRQNFEIPVQAALSNKIIARSTIKAFRKNVTEKLYGGDVTRKKKLLEKQKAGKKRMKAVGRVEIPQEAFLSILKVDD